MDRLGTQARQDRRIRPTAARRSRHELRRTCRRSLGPAEDHVLHHARQRHTAAEGRREGSHRHRHAPAESASGRRAISSRHRGLRHHSAPGQRDDGERGGVGVRTCLRGPHRCRPVHHRRVGRVPGLCSARVSTPARDCFTSTRSTPRWTAVCPRTRCCRTISSKVCTRVRRSRPTSRSSTTIPDGPRARATSTPVGSRRLAGPVVAVPVRPSRRGIERNPLSIISRWKILDNLRRSLVRPSLVVMLFAGWTVLPGSPAVWTIGALARDWRRAPAP